MPDAARPTSVAGVGPLLRDWRQRRRLSQLHLALDVGVSTRHLSCIETGRARPSPAMLDALADALQVPLRERNRLLLAAGHAPRYAQRPLDDAAMAQVRGALEQLLQLHAPAPGLVLDRQWNVVLANAPALTLAALLPEPLRAPEFNVFRASLHPQGLAAYTENFDDWAAYLLRALKRALAGTADPALAALEAEVLAYPNVQALLARSDGAALRPGGAPEPLLLPCVLRLPLGGQTVRLSLFTTLTTFGTPRDITLEELSVELFYPADAASAALLKLLAAG